MDAEAVDVDEVKAIARKMFFVFLAAGFSAFSWLCLIHTDTAFLFVVGLVLVNFAWAPFFIMGLGTKEIWPLVIGSALATFLLMRYSGLIWAAPSYVLLFTVPHIGLRFLIKRYWQGANIHIIGQNLSQKMLNLFWLISLAFVPIVAIYSLVTGIDIMQASTDYVQNSLHDVPMFNTLQEQGLITNEAQNMLDMLINLLAWNNVALLATTWGTLVFTGLVYARLYLKATKRWWGEEIHWHLGRIHISAVPIFFVTAIISFLLPEAGLLKYSIYSIASITGLYLLVNSFSALHIYARSLRFKYALLVPFYILLLIWPMTLLIGGLLIIFEMFDYWRNFRGRVPYKLRLQQKETTS